MLSTLRRLPSGVKVPLLHTRSLATATASQTQSKSSYYAPKKEGDISSVFASLSASEAVPLPSRFAKLKSSLIHGHESALISSWSRLLSSIRSEIELISAAGSSIVPTIPYSEIKNHSRVLPFGNSLGKRGVAVVKGVVAEEEALGWKEEIKVSPNSSQYQSIFRIECQTDPGTFWNMYADSDYWGIGVHCQESRDEGVSTR